MVCVSGLLLPSTGNVFFFSHKIIFTNDLDKPEKGIYNIGEKFRAHVYIDSTPALPKNYYNLFFLHFTTREPSFFFQNTIHEVIQSRNQEENSLNYLNLDFLS